MTLIDSITARSVWDSRGRPTVEAEVRLADGAVGRAIAPAGASVGTGEAVDLRDGGAHLGGYGVNTAANNVMTVIADRLRGLDATDQRGVDAALRDLDRTPQKSRLGGNATVATSMAVLHAAAASAHVPLYRHLAGDSRIAMPLPQIQIFGGGAHAGRRVDVQDFMVLCPNAGSVAEALRRTAEVYRVAGRRLADEGSQFGVADEGGWWPAFASNEAALDALLAAIEAAGFVPGEDVSIALDIAASEFGENGLYTLGLEQRSLDSDGLAELLLRWVERYPILSIEDPFAEDDPEGFRRFSAAVAGRVQIVGDDLLVTNAARVEHAAQEKLASCVLVKPNQAGTITEAREAVEAARRGGMAAIVSARSGETEDVTIAHLATGWNTGQIKVGSITRGERTAKWNELIRIEEDVGSFAGWSALGLSHAGA
jgi:enolase